MWLSHDGQVTQYMILDWDSPQDVIADVLISAEIGNMGMRKFFHPSAHSSRNRSDVTASIKVQRSCYQDYSAMVTHKCLNSMIFEEVS